MTLPLRKSRYLLVSPETEVSSGFPFSNLPSDPPLKGKPLLTSVDHAVVGMSKKVDIWMAGWPGCSRTLNIGVCGHVLVWEA